MPTSHDYYSALSQVVLPKQIGFALDHIALLNKSITSQEKLELENAGSNADRKKLLDAWFGAYIAEPVKNMVIAIGEAREWNVLFELAKMAKKTSQQTVLVTTAKPLSESLKQMIQTELAKMSETEDIAFSEDKKLIGGIKIRLNNREIDYSIKSRLAKFLNT
jgi:F0F1-type ATP synthase delta subunit